MSVCILSQHATRPRRRAPHTRILDGMDTNANTHAAATSLGTLARLLADEGILVAATPGHDSLAVTGAACDSRAVRPGDVFCCKGAAFKPAYLAGALGAGAVAYLCDEALAEGLATVAEGAPSLVVSDVRRAMSVVSAEAFGHPDRDIEVLGMTGTKGKSTVAYMLRSIIDAGEPYSRASVMGSIETYDGIEREESHNTTPEAPDLWRHLANARDSHHVPMVMEVSSHGLKYGRVDGLRLAAGAFLNIGRDHISPVEHPDFEDYFASKLRIFEHTDVAIVNLDTEMLDQVMAAAGQCPRVMTFSATRGDADVWADGIEPGFGFVDFVAHTPSWSGKVSVGMAGLFNVDNALCAIAFCELLGIPQGQVREGLLRCSVPGRMELLKSSTEHVLGIVDYAHNRLSYQRFFSSVTTEFPGRRIAAVLGAPGDKALERRRELPEEASKWADLLVYTAEDPAHERAEDICAEMAANTPAGQAHLVIPDRTEAIRHVVRLALESGEDWLVCLLAKGDETRQHVGDEFVPMEPDGDVFTAAILELGGREA